MFVGVGCHQDVTCVFTSGCQGGSGPISDNEAALPLDGDWILDGAPRVSAFFPTGLQNSGSTPVVLVFSESIQEAGLQDAFELVPLVGGGLAGTPVGGVSVVLASDGRVVVLLPGTSGLEAGDYIVRLADGAVVVDITGQALDVAGGGQLGTFSVDVGSTVPRLVMTYPEDGAANQSETTQILVVFDRPVTTQSVTAASFDVRTGGVDPVFDPLATPIVIEGGGAGIPDTRAFLYRSLGADGRPASLGIDSEIELRLSPAANPISESDGGVLAPATITFQTLPFPRPLSASLTSNPHDAIGLANLTDGDPEELMVAVELDLAQSNDAVDLFLFGEQRSDLPNPPLIALQRSVRLTGAVATVTFTREEVAIQRSSAPDDAFLNDGAVSFAFRARRGGIVTPIRVLDLDPVPEVIQDPLLDTKAPSVTTLQGSTGTSTYRSDLRGLSLAGQAGVGQAGEAVRSVEVATLLGNNGTNPVVGSTEAGLFLAAPVDLGIVAGGGTTYTFVARDRARNSSAEHAGAYTQVGVVGPGVLSVGQSIEVEVFDAGTLQPLAGTRVMVHSDQGDGVTFPFVQADATGPDGKATLGTAGLPSIGAILTVARPGYDLFTLHGVPSVRVSVPLRRSNLARARASGSVRTTDSVAVLLLRTLDQRFDDSRRVVESPRGFEGFPCTSSPGLLTCPYGPESILPERLGARSFFAGQFDQDELTFSATQLLQAFTLSVPLAAVTPNQLQASDLEVAALLNNGAPSERVSEGARFTFRVDDGSGLDLMAPFAGPFVSLETLVPGLAGSIAVSQGVAFDRGFDGSQTRRWEIRTAIPGAITAGGSLGSAGVVSSDPFTRVEIIDPAGNAVGVRPRLSTIPGGGALPEFRALAAPTLLDPGAKASTGGQAFNLLVTHAIGDERSEPGLYRVDLLDDSGRAWTLWRLDPPGTAGVPIRVVDPVEGGATGLQDGAVVGTVSAYAWASLAPASFLWTDLEREFALFSRAAPRSFRKP